jgi:hypothetical protein
MQYGYIHYDPCIINSCADIIVEGNRSLVHRGSLIEAAIGTRAWGLWSRKCQLQIGLLSCSQRQKWQDSMA